LKQGLCQAIEFRLTLKAERCTLDTWDDWREHRMESMEARPTERRRRHERTGRPFGDMAFVEQIEEIVGRFVPPPNEILSRGRM